MNRLLFACAFVGFSVVGLGAFGAHALEGQLTPKAQGWWETATFYALTHNVGALVIALNDNKARPAGWAFIIGILIFSGSLYAMALGAPTWFGAITPVGGICFLTGWAMLLKRALNRQ